MTRQAPLSFTIFWSVLRFMTMYYFIMSTYHFIQSVNHACVLSRSGVSDSLRPVDCRHRARLSVGLPRQEHEWAAVSFSRELPVPGVEPASPALAGGFFTPGATKGYVCQSEGFKLAAKHSKHFTFSKLYCLPPSPNLCLCDSNALS